MNFISRPFLSLFIFLAAFVPLSTKAVVESDLPGHSLFLHVKEWAAPFPGPGDYTIDFAAAGHDYSIANTGAIPSASGTWSFRQGDLAGSVVITLNNYFGNGSGADIVLLTTGYYELYAGTSNQNGNWSLTGFVRDPIFSPDLADQTAVENGYVNFVASLLNGTSGVSFQWFKNGVAIEGATKSSLLILALNKSHEGQYSVRVTKGSDVNTSRLATLTVVPAQTAVFNNHTFEIILTNNAPPPGLPPTLPADAYRLKSPSQFAWRDGELTFLAEYAGTGLNRNKTGVGLFALANKVLRNLVLTTELMPGTQSPYVNFGGFSDPVAGHFLFNAVARSPAGALDYAVLEWNGSTAVSRLAGKTTIPGNDSLQFTFFGIPGGAGLDAAFSGYGPGQTAGYYQFQNSTLIELFDNNSALPDFPAPPLNYDMTEPPTGPSSKRIFSLRERSTGIFRVISRTAEGAIETLFQKNTPYPGTSLLMTQLGGKAAKSLNGKTAFLLTDDIGKSFLISHDAGGLHAVAKTGDPVPGGRATILNISNFGLTDAGIVFDASTSDTRTGVYLQNQAGVLSTVVDTLSKVGADIVTGVALKTAAPSNLVLSLSLYPSGASGLAVNTAAAPSIPLRLLPESIAFTPARNLTITATTPPLAALVLEHSLDLVHWESVETKPVTGGEITISDPREAQDNKHDFYRMREATP